MKKTLLLLTLLAAMTALSAQDMVTVKFTGIDQNGKYLPLTEVTVTNVTRGWTETLAYPDTVLVLKNSAGVGDYTASACRLGNAFPNPFTGETHVPLELAEAADVQIKLVRVDGTVMAARAQHLDAGTHHVCVHLSTPGLSFLVVTTLKGSLVSKLVCTSCSGDNGIAVKAVSSELSRDAKSGLHDATHTFVVGDEMRYVGRTVFESSPLFSAEVNQAQYTDGTVALQFPVTLPVVVPEGAAKGLFSVSAGETVFLSMGNLQYQASTNTWRFAENPWDFCAESNNNISPTYNGWIDLFGWGTSGWDCGNIYYQPWDNEVDYSYDEFYGPVGAHGMVGDYANADWGVYNPISNGGNTAGMWRSLSLVEWNYLFELRNTASGIRYAMAKVNGVCGFILLPDDWKSEYYALNNTNEVTAFGNNTIADAQWNVLEQYGAAFLPCSGYRTASGFSDGSSSYNPGEYGCYWSAEASTSTAARTLRLSNAGCEKVNMIRSYGRSVRLARTYAAHPTAPMVVTEEAEVYTAIVRCRGEVVDMGGTPITRSGICWGTQENPTLENEHMDVADEAELNAFTCDLDATNLTPGVTYHFRAYAINSEGVAYGEDKTFVFPGKPIVYVIGYADITATTATVSAEVIHDFGMTVTERGVCWSINNDEPTIEDNHMAASEGGMGEFSVNLTDLTPNTQYYCRAYAINSAGISYGYTANYWLGFVTDGYDQVWPGGILPGAFSINVTQQVHFSQGNLQYIGSSETPYWKFADHQWDYLGETTGQNSDAQDVDRDLFGWGTSGYDHGAVCYQPWSTSTENSDYYAYGNFMRNLEDETGQADWGYNAIYNGGDCENLWRTLTNMEWRYLFETRNTPSGIRYAKAQVNDVNGVILLPDNWSADTYSLNGTNTASTDYTGNVIGETDWTEVLEPNGAVFLPAAGTRSRIGLFNVGSKGSYWSSTWGGYNDAIYWYFESDDLDYLSFYRLYGQSVRLVHKVDATLPVLSTYLLNYEVTETTARSGGYVTFDGGSALTAYGVCWSTHENPTLSDQHTIDNNLEMGRFDSNITGLTPGTTYYVRAYATNSVGTAYGNQKTFTTQGAATLPTVTTNPVINIAQNSAMCGGNVTDDGGAEVTACGVCWSSTSQIPTIDNNHTIDGSGEGGFTSVLSNLRPGITYYVRAYATNSAGTGYGQTVSFTTNAQNIPTVITMPDLNIMQTAVGVYGNVTDEGGAYVTARGVCWSTSPTPTINGSHTTNGEGAGVFMSVITGLTSGTNYYVRAYATNSVGTAYGEELSFTTMPTGAINGLFSVSDTRKVWFSQGNLQYKASTNTWRFAEHQYDYVGNNNSHISSSYSGWIDLFGWGTSGYDHGAVCYQPWSTSTDHSDYYPYGDAGYDLDDQTGKADWGYNAISNGGNMEHIWRTLTQSEWFYVFLDRNTQSGILFAKAKVNGKNGVILLPDNWSSTMYQLNNTNDKTASYNSNNINQADWETLLEANGAVFLPAAGLHNTEHINWVGSRGGYWSTTSNHEPSFYVVYVLDFEDDRLYPAVTYQGVESSFRCSVRLVCPAQ